jgi:putative ABC transport system permease protein
MAQTAHILSTSLKQAFLELRANKLRTFLSLLGITIGIFSIIAVLTVLDSLENNIRKSVSSLGSDVLYINRKPWMGENGEYKWWEYLQRKPMTLKELRYIEHDVPGIQYATICYTKNSLVLKHDDAELSSITCYAVTNFFDKIQNVEMVAGRYLSSSELEGAGNSIVIGHDVNKELFGSREAVGKDIKMMGRSFRVVGVMKKAGQNMAGFDFDEGVILSYYTASAMFDTKALNWNNDPVILAKVSEGVSADEVKDELTGALRTLRRVKPGKGNDFAINQLSQVSDTLSAMFATINGIGLFIAFFSLLVGSFGVANIMFVTVKERTKIIGLKKAIGARRIIILSEFLIEAVVLCLIGGLIGILLVFLLGLALTYAADFEVMLSFKNVFIGVFISAIVGTVAGFIPALRASRLDPVVAIRTT